MAYYMAARRGIDSLMDRSLPQPAILSPEILQSAIKGLMALHELELDETFCLVSGSKASHSCSSSSCPSRDATGSRVSDADKKAFDQIKASSQSGTKVLQVLSSSGIHQDNSYGFCESCVRGWEAEHAEVRKRVWDALPNVFGLED